MTTTRPQKKDKKVCIVPHLGLGDMILLNGLVRRVCGDSKEVMLFVKKAYISSVRSLFADIRNLRLQFVDEIDDLADGRQVAAVQAAGYDVMLLGDHAGSQQDWKALDPVWSRAMYRAAGLDPADMHDLFCVSRQPDREEAMLRFVRQCVGDVYVVVHDDPGRGFAVDRSRLPPGMPVVHVDDPRWRTTNIFDYVGVLENAMEVHGFDSCFMLMADFLSVRARKFCHEYCKGSAIAPGFYKSDVTIVK